MTGCLWVSGVCEKACVRDGCCRVGDDGGGVESRASLDTIASSCCSAAAAADLLLLLLLLLLLTCGWSAVAALFCILYKAVLELVVCVARGTITQIYLGHVSLREKVPHKKETE